MSVIYLKHERHGAKVACSDGEAKADMENGWVVFDPTAPVVEEPEEPKPKKAKAEAPKVEVPAFLTGNQPNS